VTCESVKSLHGEFKSRRGNHRLKHAIFLAAFAALRTPGRRPSTTEDVPRASAQRGVDLPRPGGAATAIAAIRCGEFYRTSTPGFEVVGADQAA
jgi:hypothetical protein